MTQVHMIAPKAFRVDEFHELQDMFRQTLAELNLRGRVEAFGSYRSGFRSSGSDIDVVYVPTKEEKQLQLSGALAPPLMLQRFHVALQRTGFTNIVSVYQAAVPMLKAVSPHGADVDFCVSNDLGLRNSRLMKLYADMDQRVKQVGQCIKHWAKCHDLACSTDGHLNSYAYTLLTIFYLMHTSPPIIPNLQLLSTYVDGAPDLVQDRRWGCDDTWDCQFFQDIALVPSTKNKAAVGELVRDFFRFYVEDFDWQRSAVSIRLATTERQQARTEGQFVTRCHHPSKDGLLSTQGSRAWYIEDPFDLKHNLAALCSERARQRILNEMRTMFDAMSDAEDPLDAFWAKCPCEDSKTVCYLKCCVHLEKVPQDEFVNHFTCNPVLNIFWPRQPGFGGKTEAFLMFANMSDRRRTHTLNEQYTEGGWQLRLLVCSTHAIQDARIDGCVEFEEIDCRRSSMRVNLNHANDQAQQVLHGLRVAASWEEVQVLVQRARALGLHYQGILNERMREGFGKTRSTTKSCAAQPARLKQSQGMAGLELPN